MLSFNYILITLGVAHALSHNNASMSQAWYQPPDHPVYEIFKRPPAVFPPPFLWATPNSSILPEECVNALNSAVSAGKIPNIPPSSAIPGRNPVYPNGTNPSASDICSGTYKCMIPGDIWNGPNGVFASSFDDGPTKVSCFNFFFPLILVSVTVMQKNSVYPRPCGLFRVKK